MKTKELIRNLKQCDTVYGWQLSWKYAKEIIERLEELEVNRTILSDLIESITEMNGYLGEYDLTNIVKE